MSDVYSSVDPLVQEGGWGLGSLSYQSRGIVFADWANLFTLCLAPLIAHVLGGSPKPVYLSQRAPRWHQRLWQFNPTSILWRYFVIADRRIRAKSWTASDMAASNAYFWTAQGWDGSLQMMEKSRAFALRLPTHHRVRLFSGTTLTTIIITIQGVMAIKTLIDGTHGSYAFTINISSIFYPLAVFGLLRLFAAMWLSDDYLYYGEIENLRRFIPSSSDVPALQDEPSLAEVKAQTTTSLLEPPESFAAERFHRTDSWRGILFRIIYLVPLCCLTAICLVYIIPTKSRSGFSVTTFVMVLFYLSFLGTSALIYGFYFITGHSTSSIIPCANAIWYKIYTGMITALALILVIFACLETRRSPCGVYTTYPSNYYTDAVLCSNGYVILPNNKLYPFGIAAFLDVNSNDTINAHAQGENVTDVTVISFEGICFGKVIGNVSDGAPVEPLNNTFVPTTYL